MQICVDTEAERLIAAILESRATDHCAQGWAQSLAKNFALNIVGCEFDLLDHLLVHAATFKLVCEVVLDAPLAGAVAGDLLGLQLEALLDGAVNCVVAVVLGRLPLHEHFGCWILVLAVPADPNDVSL